MRLHLFAAIVMVMAWGVTLPAQGPPFVVDPAMTVGAGASIAVAAGDAVSRLEEPVVPVRLFAERGVSRRGANIAYRFFRLTLLDLPQEQFLLVANHELFGHGGRLRERFDGPIGYRVDAPPPYGKGGGATSFAFDREPSIHEVLAISAGGMEANTLAADMMARRAIALGRLSARDAMRYLGFRLDVTSYIRGTGDAPEEPGHDVSDFIQTYNELAQATGTTMLTARTLRREVLVSFADPMLAYSLYAIGRFVAVGSSQTAIPMIRIRSVRYLPAFRYRLTPFGTEWAIANHFTAGGRSSRIEVRAGRSPSASPWGIGVAQSGVAAWRNWQVGLEGDMWRQPRLALDGSATIDLDLRLGGELRARVSRPFARLRGGSMDVVIEAAFKSNGFVAGEPLARGPWARGGVSLPFFGQ